MNYEQQIIEKLKRIEALFEGTNIEGEKNAAELAMQRLMKKLDQIKKEEPPKEYRFCFNDIWSRKLFVSLLRRYGIKPYRYHRQKYTTVMAKVSETFVNEILWKEYQELNEVLRSYLEEVTDRVIRESINADSSEAEVVNETKALMQ
jgi:polyribonucleotide nucleotidyltransferase